MITNESEAMEVWRQAFTRHNTTVALTVNGAEKADQAAARVIATALRAQSDAEVEREAIRIQARKEAIEEAARVAREFANEAALTIEGKALTNAVMAVRGNVAAAVHIAAAIRALGEGVE